MSAAAAPAALRPVRVLVVDDSALVQKVLSAELARTNDIVVVGCATDPYVARDKVLALSPDVLTLDIEMPRMDGLTFLAKLMQFRPTPVVVVSSLAPRNGEIALKALALGAVEVVPKPGSQFSVPDVQGQLAQAIRAAARARVVAPAAPAAPVAGGAPTRAADDEPLVTTDKLIAIGASTGGTRAVEEVLARVPATSPATVIVQHMPTGFTEPFARRLDKSSRMTVREARDGDVLASGLALVAPAGRHTVVIRSGSHYAVRVKEGVPVHHQRPSVDVLFHSVAKHAGPNATGVILTGMGADGAEGLRAMRDRGAFTIAEDASTCVVFGTPRVAIEQGAACAVVPLPDIARAVVEQLRGGRGSSGATRPRHAEPTAR